MASVCLKIFLFRTPFFRVVGGETKSCFLLARVQLCTIQEGGEGVKTREGGRVLLGYGGSREGAGIVDVKSRTSRRLGRGTSLGKGRLGSMGEEGRPLGYECLKVPKIACSVNDVTLSLLPYTFCESADISLVI